MNKEEKILAGACALAAVGTALYLGYQWLLAAPPGLLPGQSVSMLEDGAVVGSQGAVACGGFPRWSWHLRPVEQLDIIGSRVYPAGEALTVLARGSLTRNGAAIYRVRVNRDQQEGWCFLFGFELRGACAGESPAPPNVNAPAKLPPLGSNGPFAGTDAPIVPPPLAITRDKGG